MKVQKGRGSGLFTGILVLIAAIAALTFSACGKGVPTAKLLVKNNTGMDIKEVTVNYEVGTMVYQIFCRDCTYGAEVDVSEPRAISIEYVDENGYARFIELENPLTAEMAGKNATVWINPEGEVKAYF